jgi:integrase
MASAKLLPKDTNPKARLPYRVRYWTGAGQQKEKSFRIKKDAEDFRDETAHALKSGAYLDPKQGAVLFAVRTRPEDSRKDEYTGFARDVIMGLDKAPGTRTAYLSALDNHVGPALDGLTIAQAANGTGRQAIDTMLARMSDSGAAAVLRARCAALVRLVLDKAVTFDKINGHKCGDLKVTRDATARPATIIPATRAQLEAMAAAHRRPAEALVMWLMLGAGLRISEALAVRAGAFRDRGRVLRVSEQQQGGPGQYARLKGKAAGAFRDVPVPAWLWAKVQAHVAAHGTGAGYLFPKLTAYAYRPRFTAAAKAAGFVTGKDGMHPHALRHLYASRLLAEGIPITDCARWLGHSSIDITFQTYSHFLPSSWDRAHAILDRMLHDADADADADPLAA